MESDSKNYQQLQREERVTLDSLKQQNYSIRAIARAPKRPASTLSRDFIVMAQTAMQRRNRPA